jgi:hypothetical protein
MGLQACTIIPYPSPSCLHHPCTSPLQAVQSLYLGTTSGSTPSTTNPSLAGFVYECSAGAASFDLQSSRVVTAQLPCSGTNSLTGKPWSFNSCGSDDVYGWMDAAMR